MGERGAVRFGCLFWLVLTIAAGYITSRVLPVYLDKLALEEDLNRLVSRAGAESLPEAVVRERVIRLIHERGFQVDPADVKVARSASFYTTPQLRVDVQYSKVVTFQSYLYTLRFKSAANSFVGRL
ncbi:MAG: hypothetical protein HY645_09980 [Acidobacteria bacterium]|nr:hypothetical protein [Acidobacteriota bacterium]